MEYEKFIGKWKLSESQNLDKYLEALGFGWFHRNAAKMVKPDLIFEVTNEGKHWKFISVRVFQLNPVVSRIICISYRKVLSRITPLRYLPKLQF